MDFLKLGFFSSSLNHKAEVRSLLKELAQISSSTPGKLKLLVCRDNLVIKNSSSVSGPRSRFYENLINSPDRVAQLIGVLPSAPEGSGVIPGQT